MEGAVPEPKAVLRVEKKGEIAIVTLDRPQAMNALSRALREALANAFEELEADPETAAVILTGAGRAFCAGLDLKELGSEPAESIGGADMMRSVRSFSGPIIGAVNGHAITGGFELALACDVLIASTAAQFADTHARVGILPGWGLSQKLPRLIGIGRAKEVSLTGNFVAAEQAERWGLVNRVVAPEELLPTCRQLAEDMLSCEPRSLVRYKQVIDEGYATTFGEGMALESRCSREHLRQVKPEDVAARRAGIQARGRGQQTR